MGVHFTLDPARGRGEVPVRSVIVGAVVAVTLMVTTLTFASSLNTLLSSPPLYGWNWNYVLNPSNEPPLKTLSMLKHDPLVAAWSGVDHTDAQIEGPIVPIVLARPSTIWWLLARSCPERIGGITGAQRGAHPPDLVLRSK